MSLSLEFNKIQTNLSIPLSASSGIECKLPLSEEEGKEICHITTKVSLISVDCYNHEIKYNGKAIFNVLYKKDEVLKKCETGVEFSYKFENENVLEGMNVLAEVIAENVKINILNGIVSLSAVVVFKGEITKDVNLEYFSNEPNLILKHEDVYYSTIVDKVKREFKIEDEYDVPILVEDVLSHNEKVYITNCQCAIGCVIVDGEIEATTLFKSLQEDKDIECNVRKIPFRVEIENKDVGIDNQTCVLAKVKNSNLKVYVDEGKNKSVISIEVCIETSAKIYTNYNLNIINDAYSLDCDIKLNKENTKICQFLDIDCIEENVKEEINFKNVENSRLICVLSDKIESVNYKIVDGELCVSGLANITCLFKGENLQVESVNVPFTFKKQTSGNAYSTINSEISDVNITKTNVEFTIKTWYTAVNEKNCCVITLVEEGNKKQLNDSAISVYIPEKGDCLWDICKKLNAKEEEILSMNDNLEFPLTGEERLVVFREK